MGSEAEQRGGERRVGEAVPGPGGIQRPAPGGLLAAPPVDERDGRLEIVPATTPMRLVDEVDGVAAVADADMPVLTVDMVRDTLERVRR